jgi:putative nucleotidyltransferase with HDIG domain
MEKKRRAERLIAHLRWLVIMVGILAANEGLPLVPYLISAMAIVALYNGFASWCASDPVRFSRYGTRMALVARMMDIAVISCSTALSAGAHSLGYLLYWFVLVACGFATADLRRLALTTAVALVANGASSYYSLSRSSAPSDVLREIALRTGAIVFGSLVSAYIAKSRSQDDLASERGSYLTAIQKCGARLTSFKSVHEVARYVLSTVVAEVGASGGQLLLMDEESKVFECEASYNAESPDGEDSGGVPSDVAIRACTKWVAGSGREFVVHVRGKQQGEAGVAESDRPLIAMPLLWQSSGTEGNASVMGVFVVWGTPGENFAEDAVDIMSIFAAISAGAIVNLRLYTNLQKSFLATLQSLAKGLEARDEYTRGHSDRVMQVACLIADGLGVSGEGVELLRNASLLHDIGKIGVSDAILRKAGKLTSEEWESMRRHPVVSEEICKPLGLPPEVLFLVKHHHERLDAKGYPEGLSDKDQPLILRILVVADAFDAMRSRRPYRDVMPEDDLRAELNKCAGRTMDPTVVDALIHLIDCGELAAVYQEHDRMVSYVSIKGSSRQAA